MLHYRWTEVSGVRECVQCLALGETTVLEKKLTLLSGNDASVKFSCPVCGFVAVGIVSVDGSEPQQGEATPAAKSLIVAPTAEEIEAAKPKPPPKAQRIIVPTGPPVDVEELYAHAVAKFPKALRLDTGEVLAGTVTKGRNQDAAFIKVVYTDGQPIVDKERAPNPYHVEKLLFCEPTLPDEKEFVEGVKASVEATLKSRNPHPTRVVAPVKLNEARSRLRTICTYPINDVGTQCGDTTGACGHPGMLRNVASPGGMRANVDLQSAPDGSRVLSLQERLDPESLIQQ